MPTGNVKIAIVQFNPIVGDLDRNCSEMFRLYQIANDGGAELVIFPEMATTGYPIEDLAQSPQFVTKAIEVNSKLVAEIRKLDGDNAAILFGGVYPYHSDESSYLCSNAAFLFDPQHPERMQYTIKRELPNYGVFDEKRVFFAPPYEEIRPMDFRGNKLGVLICEDCWFPKVAKVLRDKGAQVLIALNGSPFEIGKYKTRIEVAKKRIVESEIMSSVDGRNLEILQLPFIYVNMVGGQDELVFDGGSFMLLETGLDQLPFFEEGVYQCSMPFGYRFRPDSAEPNVFDDIGMIYQASVLGLRDYMRKQGFKSAVLGMSGGVDSGIVAAIAADAIGPENVHLVRLPSGFSSEGSLTDSATANAKLGTKMRTINIEPIVNSLRAAYTDAVHDITMDDLYEAGSHPDDEYEPTIVDQAKLTGVADENIQARARGNILMAISNQEGHILLTTGNKSEVSVGYSTLYGDMAGGFNPIKDCYKTTVWAMCRYRNGMSQEKIAELGFLGRVGDMVPEEIIVKPPSAELRPDQQDSDSLPPYEVLDDMLKKMIEDQMSIREICDATDYDPVTVARIRFLLDRAEYKRRQSAPGIKITSKIHGRERRVPIINHFVETPPKAAANV
jgi:NAD+ synthase